MKIISKKCDAIHITENVLGHQRVSPIKVGKIIKKEILTASNALLLSGSGTISDVFFSRFMIKR